MKKRRGLIYVKLRVRRYETAIRSPSFTVFQAHFSFSARASAWQQLRIQRTDCIFERTRARHSNVTQFFFFFLFFFFFFNSVSARRAERQWDVTTTDDDFPITGRRSLFPDLKALEESSRAGKDRNVAYLMIFFGPVRWLFSVACSMAR